MKNSGGKSCVPSLSSEKKDANWRCTILISLFFSFQSSYLYSHTVDGGEERERRGAQVYFFSIKPLNQNSMSRSTFVSVSLVHKKISCINKILSFFNGSAKKNWSRVFECLIIEWGADKDSVFSDATDLRSGFTQSGSFSPLGVNILVCHKIACLFLF